MGRAVGELDSPNSKTLIPERVLGLPIEPGLDTGLLRNVRRN